MIILSSTYITPIAPSILKHAMDGLMNLVNFRRPESYPFEGKTNFKKKNSVKNFKYLESSSDILLSNKYLSSLYWLCNNMVESGLLPNVLSPF